MRIGIGYDIHRLTPASPESENSSIPLGGIAVPAPFKVEAHSDGDVLLHAIVDACLGALALGDIGQWFPDKDPQFKGRPSSEFLTKVMATLHGKGWEVQQVDTILILERPKVGPVALSIRENLAKLLNTELANVSLKAKTMEGLGPIGEGKALSAYATVTIKKITKEL